MREINDTALRLAKDLWKAPDPIRLLSVTALHLTEEAQSYRQLDLLGTDDTQQEKQEAVESAMDALRKKFGRGVISYGTAEDSLRACRSRLRRQGTKRSATPLKKGRRTSPSPFFELVDEPLWP